jgi:hypothetical protein
MVGSYEEWLQSFEVHKLVEYIIRECGTHSKVWRESFEIHASCNTDYHNRLQAHRDFIEGLIDTAFDAPVYYDEFITDIPAPPEQ